MRHILPIKVNKKMVGRTGFEPVTVDLESTALPLSYLPTHFYLDFDIGWK